MNKEKLFYDVLTIIYLLLIIGGLIFMFVGFKDVEAGGFIASFAKKTIINFLILIPTIIYAIAIIILAIRRATKTSDKVVVVIGSIILPGIIPLLYYFTNLRKQIFSEQSTKYLLNQYKFNNKFILT